MNKINLPQAAKLTSPNPVSVVCTMKPDASTNLATVSWWTYLSFNPDKYEDIFLPFLVQNGRIPCRHSLPLSLPVPLS